MMACAMPLPVQPAASQSPYFWPPAQGMAHPAAQILTHSVPNVPQSVHSQGMHAQSVQPGAGQVQPPVQACARGPAQVVFFMPPSGVPVQPAAPVRQSSLSLAAAAAAASGAAPELKEQLGFGDLPIVGNVWKLSRDPDGCRMVQRALEDATSDSARSALADELRGRIWQAMRCPHANHVLQKCFVTMRPQAVQFIINELVGKGAKAIIKAAQHEYACRVLQRMIEHCSPEQMDEIMETLLTVGETLSRHLYGNFVMQHILEHGTESHKHTLIVKLVEQVRVYGLDPRTSRVLRKALFCASGDDQVQCARALLYAKGIAAMARDRHAHTSAQLILTVVDGVDLAEAQSQLRGELPSLAASRYGRKVVACLDKVQKDNANAPVLGGA